LIPMYSPAPSRTSRGEHIEEEVKETPVQEHIRDDLPGPERGPYGPERKGGLEDPEDGNTLQHEGRKQNIQENPDDDVTDNQPLDHRRKKAEPAEETWPVEFTRTGGSVGIRHRLVSLCYGITRQTSVWFISGQGLPAPEESSLPGTPAKRLRRLIHGTPQSPVRPGRSPRRSHPRPQW